MPKVSSAKNRTSRRESSRDEMPGRKIKPGSKGRSFVFYGRSATGKTTLAATFPQPMLYLDIRDRGTDSISDVMEKGDVEGREIETFGQFEDMYWWLKKHPNDYETIVVDTVTQLQQLLLKEIAVEKGKDPESVGDWGSLSRKDWGEVSGTMKEWLTNYRDLTDLGINVVFLAQDRVFNSEEDETTEESEDMIIPEVGPAVIKSIAQALNASVHFIGNTYIRTHETTKEVRGKKQSKRETQYCLRIGPNPFFVTKIRKPKASGLPPKFIVDPNYEDILAVIKGE